MSRIHEERRVERRGERGAADTRREARVLRSPPI